MKVLDTDTLTLFAAGHERVVGRFLSETDSVTISIITKIEVLRGRFEAVLKAADGEQLEAAQQRLFRTERDVEQLTVLPINTAAANQFDVLRAQKKLRKIGRADLLIASIALAYGATLVTRNLRHFRQISGLITENWAD
jgi:tRNA(fMet)-specific endonuclease VapC